MLFSKGTSSLHQGKKVSSVFTGNKSGSAGSGGGVVDSAMLERERM
jgi:hypothetical protein